MTFRVVTTSEADSDVASIWLFINSHSPQGAAAWLDAYDLATEKVAVNADSCPLTEEYERFDVEVRETSFKTRRGKRYRLVFTIAGNEIRILRVRGPGQSAINPNDI